MRCAVKFGDGLAYSVTLQVKDCRLGELLHDVQDEAVMSGKLTATTTWPGTVGCHYCR